MECISTAARFFNLSPPPASSARCARALRLCRHARRPPPGGGDPARRAGWACRGAAAWRQGLCLVRGQLALQTGGAGALHDLDGFFGLHPSFANLKTPVRHQAACGLPQYLLALSRPLAFRRPECAGVGRHPAASVAGWLAQSRAAAHGHHQWRSRLAVAQTPPLMLSGKVQTGKLDAGGDAGARRIIPQPSARALRQ